LALLRSFAPASGGIKGRALVVMKGARLRRPSDGHKLDHVAAFSILHQS
jgi:hypothetical protein